MQLKSVSTQFVVMVAAVIVVAMAGLVTYVTNSTYALLRDSQVQSMNMLAGTTVRTLDTCIQQRRILARNLAGQDAVRRGLSDLGYGPAQDMLATYVESHGDQVWGLFVADPRGRIQAGVMSGGKSLVGVNVADRDYFQAAMSGEEFISDPFKPKVGSGLVFSVAHPVQSSSGVMGVAVAVVSLARFSGDFVDPITIGESGYAFVLNDQGQLIAHPDEELVLSDQGGNDFVQKALEQGNGFIEYAWKGQDKFMSFRRVDSTGWVVCISASESDLVSAANTNRNILIGAGALITLALIAVVVAGLSRAILAPLSRIKDYAQEVAAGNLDTRPRGEFKHEMEDVRGAIESMVEDLKAKMKESEAKEDKASREAERAEEALGRARKQEAEVKRLLEDMKNVAGEADGVSNSVSRAAEALAEQVDRARLGAETQMSRMTSAATAMEEMNATVLEVARYASQAAEQAETTQKGAREGSRVVDQTVWSINSVSQQSGELKKVMNNLGEQADSIGQIMNVITDIADQTNLLALNAAIEAARAGEAGRGFAVVADEVRKLAEKTMSATKEVGRVIENITSGVEDSLTNMEHMLEFVNQANKLAATSGSSLEEILQAVEVTSDQVRSIATAAEEQSSTSEEINTSVSEVTRISQDTLTAMEDAREALEQLAYQAQNLENLIHRMK
jgi:methyl-accepting chemotaxis protein